MVLAESHGMSIGSLPSIFIYKYTHIYTYVKYDTCIRIYTKWYCGQICACVYWMAPEFIYISECFSVELTIASEKCMMEA